MYFQRICSYIVSAMLLITMGFMFFELFLNHDYCLPEFLCRISITCTFSIDFFRIILSLIYPFKKSKKGTIAYITKDSRRFLLVTLCIQLVISTVLLLIANILKFRYEYTGEPVFYISANSIFFCYVILFFYTKYRDKILRRF